MNDIIHDIIMGYINAFDAYPTSNASLLEEINQFKSKLINFGESNNDIATFHQRLADSGLQEEYMTVITKAVMASSGSANEDGSVKTDYSDTETQVMSVKDFVEQYRSQYDEIKASSIRKRTEEAYEEIFNVANRTDNMIEAQIILEKERLLWKIVSMNALDIFEPLLEAMDPLQEATSITLKMQIDAYRRAQSPNDLLSIIEGQELKRLAIIQKNVSKIAIVSLLSFLLFEYCKAKEGVWQWMDDKKAKGAVSSMISHRNAIRKIALFLKEEWGSSLRDLLSEEGIRIWLLLPTPVDAFGRIKTALSPYNYQVFMDILNNEILSDISIKEILLREETKGIHYNLNNDRQKDYDYIAEKRAEVSNSTLTYYINSKEIDAAYASYENNVTPS